MTNTCSVPGCEGTRKALGYCMSHYSRQWRLGDVRADVPLRGHLIKKISPDSLWCSSCQAEKSDEEMMGAEGMRSKGLRSGRCKECHSKKRSENKWELKRRYQLTPDDYARLLAEQGGVCALCEKPPRKNNLAVDHDHACCPGEISCGNCIRGLLCISCNNKIEWFIHQRCRAEEYLAKRANLTSNQEA